MISSTKRKESEEVENCGVSSGNCAYSNFAKVVNMSKERLGMKRSVGARRYTHGFFRSPLFSFCIGVSQALRISKRTVHEFIFSHHSPPVQVIPCLRAEAFVLNQVLTTSRNCFIHFTTDLSAFSLFYYSSSCLLLAYVVSIWTFCISKKTNIFTY